MQVFRIAYDNISTGIWYGKPDSTNIDVINALKMLKNEHPMPYDENFPKDYLCCCPSYEVLQCFFGDYLYHLLDVGFTIYIYEIPEEFVRTYKQHCIANFSKGKLVRRIAKRGNNID